MQDGASCHRSKSALKYLRKEKVKLLEPWPSQSPNCNPVEHCWAFLANKLWGQSFLSSAELEAAICKAWEERPTSLIPNPYGSMVRRLFAVQVAKGGGEHTSLMVLCTLTIYIP